LLAQVTKKVRARFAKPRPHHTLASKIEQRLALLGAFFALLSMVITLVQVLPEATVTGKLAQIGPFLLDIVKNSAFWISVGTTVLASAAAGFVKNPKA
jgi:hypothetical protein